MELLHMLCLASLSLMVRKNDTCAVLSRIPAEKSQKLSFSTGLVQEGFGLQRMAATKAEYGECLSL